jgi:tetratricopeptide (TPR) repeat protein
VAARPFRYTLILVAAALGTGLAALGGWRYAKASAPVNGPVIVISIDAVRADHLPAYGYRDVKTPAIDTLAADGVVFERAYSHVPLTLPSHVALLSGRLPFETGVRDDGGATVRPGERLLAELLRERGYTTGGIVSAATLRKESGLSQGFDFFDGAVQPAPLDLLASSAWRDGAESEGIAERWLGSAGTSRAFLFLHIDEPAHAPGPAGRGAASSNHDAALARSDEIVGRLVRYLKSHQLYDRSTIFLLSDYGQSLGEHGTQGHGVFLYEETLHVPFIVKPEGSTGAGRRITDPVQLIDLVPTILDLAKAPVPGHLRGRSLKPLLESTSRFPERAIYSESLYAKRQFGWSDLAAITRGRYRYIRAPQEELYDLERDPGEHQNIAPTSPDVVQKMRAALQTIVADAPKARPVVVTGEARERIEALGYIAPDAGLPAPSASPADPKDKRAALSSYQKALEVASERGWSEAVRALQQLLRQDPRMIGAWSDLASLAAEVDRLELAVDAREHQARLEPSDPFVYLGLASTLFKAKRFDEARRHAEAAAALLADQDPALRREAHEWLARIALATRDADEARRQAKLVQQIDPRIPMTLYVDARILSDQGRHSEAMPIFEQALAALKKGEGEVPDLHFHAADALFRLGRYAEAENEFVEEIREFPRNTRARAGLVSLYQATNRPDEAASAIAQMIQLAPSAESYSLATRLWKSLGNIRQANATRAEAQKHFFTR